MSLRFVTLEELVSLFFYFRRHVFTRQRCFAAAGPPPWGKVWYEVSIRLRKRPHKHGHSSREVHCLLSAREAKHTFDHIQVQLRGINTQRRKDARNATKQWRLWHTQSRLVHTPLPTRTHIDKEPKALRWKPAHRAAHHMIDPQPTRPHTHISRHPGEKIDMHSSHSFSISLYLSPSLSHTPTLAQAVRARLSLHKQLFPRVTASTLSLSQWQATNPWHHHWW